MTFYSLELVNDGRLSRVDCNSLVCTLCNAKDLALVDSSVPRHSLSPRTQIRLKTFIFIIGLIVFRLEFLAVRTPRSEIQ